MPATPTTTPPHVPFPTGMALPTFRYSLHTADRQVRTISYALHHDGTVSEEEDTGWDDEESVMHTASATLDVVTWDGANDVFIGVTGDQHRDLEDGGQFEEWLRAIAWGEPAAEALARLTKHAVAA